MECLDPQCPTPQPKLGLCEDCAFEQLDAKFGIKQALEIIKIIYGE